MFIGEKYGLLSLKTYGHNIGQAPLDSRTFIVNPMDTVYNLNLRLEQVNLTSVIG